VGEQQGRLVLWARVDPDALTMTRTILIRATGEPFDGSESRYVGTVQMAGGLVWHVFESH
jgi:hypothetical protein